MTSATVEIAASGYIQTRWYQQSTHGGSPMTSLKNRLPSVATTLTSHTPNSGLHTESSGWASLMEADGTGAHSITQASSEHGDGSVPLLMWPLRAVERLERR